MKDNFSISKNTAGKILHKYNLGQCFSLEEIESGLINPVFVINNQYVLKVNTKADSESKQKFEKEAYLYSFFSKLDIPVPTCFAFDQSGEIIDKDYLLISYIEGDTLAKAFKNADTEVRHHLAYQLGSLAKKIHTIDISGIMSRSDLFGNGKGWSKTVELEFVEYLSLVKEKRLLPEQIIKEIEILFKEFLQLINYSSNFALIHGDFSKNNFKTRDGRIVGIFDFEMAKIGDPYYDLQKLPINFQLGNGFDKSAFLAGYGQKNLSEEEKIRLKIYAVFQGLWELWATETQEFPFGKKEIKEGKELILKALKDVLRYMSPS